MTTPAKHHTDDLPRIVRDKGGVALRVATQDDLDRASTARSTGEGAAPTLGYFYDESGAEVFLDFPDSDSRERWPELMRQPRGR